MDLSTIILSGAQHNKALNIHLDISRATLGIIGAAVHVALPTHV
jgi:hypothetical protein